MLNASAAVAAAAGQMLPALVNFRQGVAAVAALMQKADSQVDFLVLRSP
ncbi:hypothetical protein EMIT0347P_130031 [Pseudomonas sp. IT-347P]